MLYISASSRPPLDTPSRCRGRASTRPSVIEIDRLDTKEREHGSGRHSAQSNSKRVNYKERGTKIRYRGATPPAAEYIVVVIATTPHGLISSTRIPPLSLSRAASVPSQDTCETLRDCPVCRTFSFGFMSSPRAGTYGCCRTPRTTRVIFQQKESISLQLCVIF